MNPRMPSHEVVLTRKVHPRDSIVIDAGGSELRELVEIAATVVSLGPNWEKGPAFLESTHLTFEIEFRRDGHRFAQLNFKEPTPGEPDPRLVALYGPEEAEDLLAVAK